MEFKIASERVLICKEQFTLKEAEAKAWSKKLEAFGTLDKFTSFLSRPKEEDFELIYQEHRYQPFWHVASKAHYVYDRDSHYQFEVTGHEVGTVTLEGKNFPVTNGHLHVPVIEHCQEDLAEELLMDGVSGEKKPSLKEYLNKAVIEVKGKDIKKSLKKDDIVVPPQTRISAIMREMLAHMIQGIQADKIFEEQVEVTYVDLYYRPIYAFQYRWKSKNKEAILEFDGITGATQTGSRTFNEYLGKVLDIDFLFDLGADAAGIFLPGGSIAVKVAKKYLDKKTKK